MKKTRKTKPITIPPVGIVVFDLLIATASPVTHVIESNDWGPKTNLYSLPGQILKETQLQIHANEANRMGQ